MRLKLGIVGPSGCGKTLISNILGNEMNMDSSIGRPPYRPTNSVRIVEFSVPNIDLRKYSAEIDIQLWEIGGNPRLKSIWPGVQSNLDGVIMVYDTNNELHVRDMSALHMHFITHSSLNPMQSLIIGNQFRGTREVGPAKIVGVGPRVRHFVVNVDDDPNYLRDEFRHYLTGLAQLSLDQERAPPGSNFMTEGPCEGEGDQFQRPLQLYDYRQFQIPEASRVLSESVDDSAFTEFHQGRKSRQSKTRTRRDEGIILKESKHPDDNAEEESYPRQGVRNIDRDAFSIHRRLKNN